MVVVAAQPWWLLSPWLSPSAAWFIFFNAVVAAIAVMSPCCAQQDAGHVPSSRRRLCRSASSSVVDQLRSFSLFSVYPTTASGVTGPELDDLAHVSGPDYYSCSPEAEVVPAHETPRPTTPVIKEIVGTAARSVAPLPCAPAAAADADSVSSAPESKDEDAEAEEEQHKSMSLDEAYALIQLQRRPRQSPSAPPASVAATATTAASLLRAKDQAAKKAPKRRARSGGRGAEEAMEGEAELNARAELFIRQFREELKLQRLNSLLLRHTHAFGTFDGAPIAAVW